MRKGHLFPVLGTLWAEWPERGTIAVQCDSGQSGSVCERQKDFLEGHLHVPGRVMESPQRAVLWTAIPLSTVTQ